MKVSKTIHIEMDLLNRANKQAEKDEVSLNYVIETALRKYFEVIE